MKTAIIYYSKHHGNTKKLVDAIKAFDPSVDLVDINTVKKIDLSGYDIVGIASGIYGAKFAKEIVKFTDDNLPEGKKVFFLFTSSMNNQGFTKTIKAVTDAKKATFLGQYGCTGYDTFGPFKLIGGVAKGHPDQKEINGAVEFYKSLA